MCYSWSWSDRHVDCLLHDEALQVHSSRVHRMVSHLSARLHHRATAKLLGRVSALDSYVFFFFMCSSEVRLLSRTECMKEV